MKRQMLNWALGVALSFMGGASAFAATYAEEAQSLQTIKVFVNDSGAALVSGTAVILNMSSTNATTGTSRNASSSLGLLITTTTVADSKKVVGIVKDDSCADQSECRVVTWGPVIARFACSTDNTLTIEGAVGTTTVAGQVGTGSNLGILMSPSLNSSATTDNCSRWIFVTPVNS